jgi:hypothetical protein
MGAHGGLISAFSGMAFMEIPPERDEIQDDLCTIHSWDQEIRA